MTVREKVLSYCEAIHTQDPVLFESLWSKENHDNCILISVGKIFKGYESILQDFLLGGIQATYESIELIPEDIAVTYQDAGYAIVTFPYHTECIRRDDGSPFGISGVETQVWKHEDEWRMIHLHYSKV